MDRLAIAVHRHGDTLEQLRRRGLVAQAGAIWQLTDEGRAMRDAIESDTDGRAAPPWVALGLEQRGGFLDSLAGLPD